MYVGSAKPYRDRCAEVEEGGYREFLFRTAGGVAEAETEAEAASG